MRSRRSSQPTEPRTESLSKQHRQPGWFVRWRVAAIALTAIVTVLLVAQTSAGRTAEAFTGLISQPTAYSAVYFTEPDSLPAALPARGAPVAFGIQNDSATSGNYQWTVSLTQGTATRQLAAGRVTVPAGQTRQQTVRLRPACAAPASTGSGSGAEAQGRSANKDADNATVAVRLTPPAGAGPAESIDFRTVCGG